MLQIAVCDDIRDHLQLAEKMVRECLDKENRKYEIQLFKSAESLYSETEKNDYQPDIAVLDIEMDGEDGISLAKKLNTLVPLCRIIFLTSYVDYAPEVYETEHIWFVVKNRADEHFAPAMAKALASLSESERSSDALIIRDSGSSLVIPLANILYLSKVHRKAYIRCTDGEYSDTRRPAVLIPEHLQDRFIRCHQGYWVSKAMIKELDHDEFVLLDGTRIPISRSFRDTARKEFFDMYRL